MMSKILIVDDDPDWLMFVSGLLKLNGYEVQLLKNADQLAPAVRQFKPDLVITDIMMPGTTGSGVHQVIRREIGADLPILVCSSTKLKVKSEDPLLVHLTKQDAVQDLLPTLKLMLGQNE